MDLLIISNYFTLMIEKGNDFIYFSIIGAILINIVLLIKNKFYSKRMLYVFLGSILFLVIHISKNFNEIEFSNYLKLFVIFLIFFCFCLILFYKKIILPSINERIIHLVSIIYIYNIFAYSSPIDWMILFIISVIPFSIIIYNLIIDKKIDFVFKIGMYLWFLFMLIFIELNYLKKINIIEFIDSASSNPSFFSFLNIFYVTTTSLFIMIYSLNMIFIIPIPFRESIDNMTLRVKKQAHLFVYKLKDEQTSPINSVIITILVSGILFLNFLFNFISHDLLTELYMIFIFNVYIHITRKHGIKIGIQI